MAGAAGLRPGARLGVLRAGFFAAAALAGAALRGAVFFFAAFFRPPAAGRAVDRTTDFLALFFFTFFFTFVARFRLPPGDRRAAWGRLAAVWRVRFAVFFALVAAFDRGRTFLAAMTLIPLPG